MARAIKEEIYIRVNIPTLNRNIGKYSLPHTWDRVMLSISELKTKDKKIKCHLQSYRTSVPQIHTEQ